MSWWDGRRDLKVWEFVVVTLDGGREFGVGNPFEHEFRLVCGVSCISSNLEGGEL